MTTTQTAPADLVITLTPWEEWQAREVANARRLTSRALGMRHRGFNPNPSAWQDDFGAGAELAVARYANVYWPASIATGKAVADVGTMTEVRTTGRRDGGLIIRQGDPEDRIYVLVVHGDWPVFRLAGWLFGRDMMTPAWRQSTPDPWWQVPQAYLHPMTREAVL
jgi:hypothetical protein